MKRFLVVVFMAVFTVGFSQSEEKMKFINTHSVEYNGEKIKIRDAKKVAKEKASNVAFKEFRKAQFYRAGSIYLDVAFLGSFIVSNQLSSVDDPNRNYDDGLFDGFLDATSTTILVGSGLCSALRVVSIHRAINAFNESN
tara:strand:- start:73 stop:492 length:420 start_codon:yes stop_codon:yes gene_type:complete